MFLTGVFLVPLLGGEALQLSSNAWLLLPVSLALSLTAISFALLIAVWVKPMNRLRPLVASVIC